MPIDTFERTERQTRRARPALLLAAAFAMPFALASCASTDDAMDLTNYVESVEPADTLYNQGLANLEAGRLSEAASKFEAVDRQHPYSEYARRSMVMSAFTQYRQGNYQDAINSARRYVQLYPNDSEAAYAQYIVGLSYWRQISDVTQDQADARRTIEAMEAVTQRWPDSEYVEDANTKIRYARDQLAGKEMQIGRYYLERREYVAAVKRFRLVVETYSNTRHVEEALARLTESYYAMGLASEAQTAAAVLGHNYPDSQWYRDSYALLQSGGLQPRENSGSWISRAGSTLFGRS
ncbi:outer membrane protein assembly factor BamD [Aliihoeflea aestuarii]|jgi:outer membrane protein assembly factor BamD|uniref:outer membrane protein assembly factor BamD n=1 Tax=Aliihoeflea aestuarii TaxID=453840 RepID=UPI0025B5EAE8|nr:outer membrane protein assembly factor BamD [Aliihoeflea aestuarii]MCO6392255.1 outer membrane protein assembly factor BamD [Aliihoeflea aestuarii]